MGRAASGRTAAAGGVICLFALLSLAGTSIAAPATTRAAAHPAGKKFTAPDIGFSIVVPETWNKVEVPNRPTFTLAGPGPDGGPGVILKVQTAQKRADAADAPEPKLDEFCRQLASAVTKQKTGEVAIHRTKLAGDDARQFTVTLDNKGKKNTSLYTVVRHGDGFVIVTYLEDAPAVNMKAAESMLETVQWTK